MASGHAIVTDSPPTRAADAPLVAIQGLAIRHFDDGAVVFDPLSWDAHLLNPSAIAVLELLLESPHSETEIVAFLAEALCPEEQPQATAHGVRLIRELRSLGLIRAAEATAHANRRNP